MSRIYLSLLGNTCSEPLLVPQMNPITTLCAEFLETATKPPSVLSRTSSTPTKGSFGAILPWMFDGPARAPLFAGAELPTMLSICTSSPCNTYCACSCPLIGSISVQDISSPPPASPSPADQVHSPHREYELAALQTGQLVTRDHDGSHYYDTHVLCHVRCRLVACDCREKVVKENSDAKDAQMYVTQSAHQQNLFILGETIQDCIDPIEP